jgi:SAM-dependent methyltransferase
VSAADLTSASVYYRHPELFDQVSRPDAAGLRAVMAARHRDRPTSMLDLGCATGALLAAMDLPVRVGVDLLPRMIDHGCAVRPDLDLRVGDIRTIRLRRTFDLVTCLGATLAYLPDDGGLDAACATIAAHTAPGGLIVLQTLTAPVPSGPPLIVATTLHGQPATTKVSYQWRDPVLTTRRTHRLADGTLVHDRVPRRVWTTDQLRSTLARHGLTPHDSGARYLTASHNP